MKIIVNGQTITLSQQQFVAKGGEAMVFNSGSIAYKVYEDLKKMVPEAKLKELATLTIPNIVAPKDLIYNKKKQIIGFTMAWLGDDTVALCKLFTTGFRNSNQITDDQTLELIENIKDTTTYVHENGFLIVDGNELNYMVDNDFVTPYFIDVNAWQTPSFPPTAIMPSIRDFRSKTFSEVTDWFSFAIVSFQLFTGVHPFKGKHPKYKKRDFESRIKDCISVINPAVKVPPNVRDFGLIPAAYMDWYIQLFEKGERLPPPLKAGQIGHVKARIILVHSTDNFDIKELESFDSDIVFHDVIGGKQIVKTKNYLYIDKTKHKVSPDVEAVFTPMEGIPIFVKIEDGFIKMHCSDNYYKLMAPTIKCSEKMIVNNMLFLKNKEKLIELAFNVMGTNITAAIKTVWTIEPNSSQILSGVISQSVLGKSFIAIPLPTYHKSKFIIKQIPEFDDYRIIDGKHENRVCMFNLHKNGEYSRATLIFDKTYNKYVIDIKEGIDYTPINFVVLDNGVCISITDDDAVEIFINMPDIKRIEDPEVNSAMKLCHDGVQVRVFKGEKLFTIKMR
jgi:hypothetical protein